MKKLLICLLISALFAGCLSENEISEEDKQAAQEWVNTYYPNATNIFIETGGHNFRLIYFDDNNITYYYFLKRDGKVEFMKTRKLSEPWERWK